MTKTKKVATIITTETGNANWKNATYTHQNTTIAEAESRMNYKSWY